MCSDSQPITIQPALLLQPTSEHNEGMALSASLSRKIAVLRESALGNTLPSTLQDEEESSSEPNSIASENNLASARQTQDTQRGSQNLKQSIVKPRKTGAAQAMVNIAGNGDTSLITPLLKNAAQWKHHHSVLYSTMERAHR